MLIWVIFGMAVIEILAAVGMLVAMVWPMDRDRSEVVLPLWVVIMTAFVLAMTAYALHYTMGWE